MSGINTAGTFLMYSIDDGVTFLKMVDILGYPDMGSTPSKLDTTDLSALKFKTSVLGLQEVPDLTFEANYDDAKYDEVSALNETYTFQLQFGTDGVDGIFEWTGEVTIFAMGGGVDEVRKMQITCSAETEIVTV